MLLFINCIFAVVAIQVLHQQPQHTPKTFTPSVVAESDRQTLSALNAKFVHHENIIVRERAHQVHLAQVRASRSEQRVVEPATPAVSSNSVWDQIAGCESSGNWQDTAGFYEGGLQFDPRTWDDNKPSGYPDHAYEATREQQISVAEKVLSESSWAQQWPACSLKLGLR